MKSRCSECKDGPYSSMSDRCDECRCDGDTGWGGFTDNSIGVHFMSEKEQKTFYEIYMIDEDDE